MMSHLTLPREYRTDATERHGDDALRHEYGRATPSTSQPSQQARQSGAEVDLEPMVERTREDPRPDVVAIANARRDRLMAALAKCDEFLFIAEKLCALAEREQPLERFSLILDNGPAPALHDRLAHK